MDGWMDGWRGGWMDGWMDGWIDGWIGGWMGSGTGCQNYQEYAFIVLALTTSQAYIHIHCSSHIQELTQY